MHHLPRWGTFRVYQSVNLSRKSCLKIDFLSAQMCRARTIGPLSDHQFQTPMERMQGRKKNQPRECKSVDRKMPDREMDWEHCY